VNLGEIEETMAALALVRPLFHSEADFQHAFAWQLHSAHPDARATWLPSTITIPRVKVRSVKAARTAVK